MGTKCPECGEQAAYVMAITATGEPATKHNQIIARKLSCGHVVGSKAYMEYRKQIASIEEDEANRIRAIKDAGEKARLDVWAKITALPAEV